ncbi:putative holin-like toxin [Fictibacillus sp. WQ 8-8]
MTTYEALTLMIAFATLFFRNNHLKHKKVTTLSGQTN